MTKFKEGQKVRVIGNTNKHKFSIGEVIILDKLDPRECKAYKLDKSDWWYVRESDIEPIEEKTFPRKMWVWNGGENPKDHQRIVLGILGKIVVAVDMFHEQNFKDEKFFHVKSWHNCAEIEPEPELVLSMQEIADKFGVKVENLKIQK